MPGLFISFEGGEGCGKSTQIDLLTHFLKSQGHRVTNLREPGGTPLGEKIRHLLQHDPDGQEMTTETELLLFAASRAQLTRTRIQPALDRGEIVICDRFMDSTTVYQGVARQIDEKTVEQINHFAVGPTLPDLTLLLDLPPEIGMSRVHRRTNGNLDRMEQEADSFFQAVREGYLKLAEKNRNRFRIIDAEQPIETVGASIKATISEKLKK